LEDLRAIYLKHHRFAEAAVVLAGANAATEFLEPILSERDQEIMVAAYCDDRLQLVELLWFPGRKASVEVPIREIFRFTREGGGIILAHNHPSGNALPSDADKLYTQRVGFVAEAMQVTLLDHLIFGAGRVFSFRQAGLL
jgi:DNA repair protein RadC